MLPYKRYVVEVPLAALIRSVNLTYPFDYPRDLLKNIPQIDFSEITSLSPEQRDIITRRGCVVIHNVVDDEKALEWKKLLQEYIDLNPQVEGFPSYNKQFFEI